MTEREVKQLIERAVRDVQRQSEVKDRKRENNDRSVDIFSRDTDSRFRAFRSAILTEINDLKLIVQNHGMRITDLEAKVAALENPTL